MTSPSTAQLLPRDDDGYVTGEVGLDLAELIDNDLEGVLDLLSERLVGSALLMDVSYRAVRVEDDGTTVVMQVTGDPSECQGYRDGT